MYSIDNLTKQEFEFLVRCFMFGVDFAFKREDFIEDTGASLIASARQDIQAVKGCQKKIDVKVNEYAEKGML